MHSLEIQDTYKMKIEVCFSVLFFSFLFFRPIDIGREEAQALAAPFGCHHKSPIPIRTHSDLILGVNWIPKRVQQAFEYKSQSSHLFWLKAKEVKQDRSSGH